MEPCPACSGLGCLVGRLGRLVWLSCRACGLAFTVDQADCQEEVH